MVCSVPSGFACQIHAHGEAVMFEIQPFLKRLKKTAFVVRISVFLSAAGGCSCQKALVGLGFGFGLSRLNRSLLCGRAAVSSGGPRRLSFPTFLPWPCRLQVRMTMRRSSVGKTGAWGPRLVFRSCASLWSLSFPSVSPWCWAPATCVSMP